MIELLRLLVNVLTWMVILHVVMSYFLPPYHVLREGLERIIEPLLSPIRRIMPPVAGLDFSPLVLILLINLLGNMLANLLSF
ncbi:MAG: YggT family protein [Anaerolineales bacterium]|nr:YggT family protein [Anaerolineales bacterium]